MSEVRQFTRRHTKRVTLVAAETGDEVFPPVNLLEFADWIADQIQAVPHRYQSSARIDIGVVERRHSTDAEVCISYTRPETDDEMEARALSERNRQEAEEQRELSMLEQLQEKYKNKFL